ncbi:MAG: Asp-tRNA(Asn)/Glu-tRNA(Gln) amidotransferase subunit GatC [Planctomycetota bacterium]|nr:Asp-tRNA(Asn)/Glu-tRNA(Gln) amidotransferase subunit GatC [Planctomycetota bacterium]
MSLTREEIEKVALLARLRLSPDELETMTVQLSQIVEYVEQLSELDTESVQPMVHAIDVANVFAGDDVRPSFERDEMLGNAPNRDEECYLVPPVLGS